MTPTANPLFDRIEAALNRVYAALPAGAAPVAVVVLALALAYLAHLVLWRLLRRALRDHGVFGRDVLARARLPVRLFFYLLALSLVLPLADLPDRWRNGLTHLALVILIVTVGWVATLLVNLFAERSVRHLKIDADDNLSARKMVTQLRVLRRVVDILIYIVTAAAVLFTFESVRTYGISLFASAGAAGLVVGLAARPVLANLIAGVQIALTQPIRIEDVVIVEDQYGWVEEIFATYVVIRLWDWRRLVVPLSYFIEKPFENWTRESASLIGNVVWYVDYTAPVEAMRDKLTELVGASPLWDGKVVNLQVVETGGDAMQVRGLMSARTSPQAWDLRCAVREGMIAWLQAEHPQVLPRTRVEAQLQDASVRRRGEPEPLPRVASEPHA